MGRVELFRHTDDVERPEGVRTNWISVTPDYATRTLEAYERFCDEHPSERMNRPVHQAQVSKYAADMKAGRWGRNHQGLAFDRHGILMDGQHRLWAVIESDVAVMMPATYGLDREAQLTIDSGLMRSTADVAAIAGFDGVKSIHVAIARGIVRGVSPTRPVSTRMQELEILRDHWKAVEFVVGLFPKGKLPGITRAPVFAAIARAFYSQEPSALQRFAEVLATGITKEENEHVVITLRNWLMTTRGAGGAGANEAYGKATRALHAYLRGERIRTLYASREDLFPLPVAKRK